MMNVQELNAQLASLHDAVLLSVEMLWAEGKILLAVRTADGMRRLVIERATRLECAREFPWGRSVCINEIRLTPTPSSTALRMDIEMQSGDVLVVSGHSAYLDV